jgi:hypothetical protein
MVNLKKNISLKYPKKKRKYTHRVVTCSPEDMFQAQEDLQAAKSCVPVRSHFSLFKETLVTAGTIVWREHTQEGDSVVLSDYCETTSKVKLLDYVHVTALYDGDEMILACSCKIYSWMEGIAMKKYHLQNNEHAVLDHTFTCMHCRFFREELYPIRNTFGDPDRTSQLHKKIQEGIPYLNQPVALLGPVSTNSTTKFSVYGEKELLSVVNLSFDPSGVGSFRCPNGTCEAHKNHIKGKLPYKKPINKVGKKGCDKELCEHLVTINSHIEYIKQLLPGCFDKEEGTYPGQDPNTIEINQEDQDLKGYESGKVYFDKYLKYTDKNGKEKIGKWVSKSESQYQPKFDRFDAKLVNNTAQRLQCVQGQLVKGFYQGPTLSVGLHGPHPCNCGAGFGAGSLEITRNTKVYTRQVIYNKLKIRNHVLNVRNH